MYNKFMEIRVKRNFHAAHRIWQHQEKCRFLHGHSYKVKIKASGKLDKWGMIADFGDVKGIVDHLDHCVILYKGDPLVPVLKESRQRLFLLDRNPTAENLAKLICFRLITELNLDWVEVEVFETENQSALATMKKGKIERVEFEKS